MWLLVVAILQHADALRLDLNDTSRSQTDSESAGSCASICYGDHGFHTSRLGSRLFVLLQGFHLMQQQNIGYMMFSKMQRLQLSDVLKINEDIVSLQVGSNATCTKSSTGSQLIAVPSFDIDVYDIKEMPIVNDTFGNSLAIDLNRTHRLDIEVNRSTGNSFDKKLSRSNRLNSDLNGSSSVDIVNFSTSDRNFSTSNRNFSTLNSTEVVFADEKLKCQGWTPGEISKFHPTTGKFLVESRAPMIEFARRFRTPCTEQKAELSDKTLVMHMRAGDVFRKRGWHDSHAQPPCAFYEHAFETGLDGNAFEHGIIVVGEGGHHPCINPLVNKFGEKIRVQSRYLVEDACYIMEAKHVALSVSALAGGLMHLNWNVRKAFIPTQDPTSVDANGNLLPWWDVYVISDGKMPYEQNIYSFPGYDFRKGMRDSEYMQSYSQKNLTKKKVLASKSAPNTKTPALKPAKQEAP